MADYTQVPIIGQSKPPGPLVTLASPAIKIPKATWKRDPGISEFIDHLNQPALMRIKKLPERWEALAKSDISEISKILGRCRNEFHFAARNFFLISTKDRGDKLFSLWEAQELLLEYLMYLKSKNIPQLIQIIKSRQLGCSTLIEALIAWRSMFFNNVMAFVVADTAERAAKLFGIMQYIYDHIPWWLKPMLASREYKDGLIFDNPEESEREQNPGLHSQIVVNYATKLSGIGQGYSVNAAHVCFVPSTLVKVDGGILKPMLDVKPGELVINSHGIPTSVRQVVKSSRRNEVTAGIRIWGNTCPLETTIDHNILTPDGFKRADQITAGSFIRVPVRPIEQTITSMAFREIPIGGGRWIKKFRNVEIPCSSEWGWFFGLYLAEGHAESGEQRPGQRISFGINEDEESEFRPRLEAALAQNSLKSAFRVGQNKHKGSKTLELRVSWTGLGKYITSQFGRTDSKRIPDWVWNAGTDFCRALVQGYLEGDGHVNKTESLVSATSTRVSLTSQIRDLVASLGYGWSAISYRPAGHFYGRNCQAAWTWRAASDTAECLSADMGWPHQPTKSGEAHWNYSEDQAFVDLEVESTYEGFSEEFYDLEVESPDHAFCTFQACTKNSEYPSYDQKKAREIIEEDLGTALAKTAETFAFLEGTAKGAGTFAHKLWLRNVNLGDDAKWFPKFLPSFFDMGHRRAVDPGWIAEPIELDLRERIAKDWLRCTNQDCLQYHERFFRGMDRETETCPTCGEGRLDTHIVSDDFLSWMAHERKNAQDDLESQKALAQEECVTAEQAFQSSGHKTFSDTAQSWAQKNIENPTIGMIDKAIKFHACCPAKKRKGAFPGEFWYACFQPECEADHQFDHGQLAVYRWPQRGGRYVIGVDVSEGLGGDNNYSVASVLRVDNLNEPDEQVAVFRSNSIDRLGLSEIVVWLGYWYNTALIAVESNRYDTVANAVQNTYLYPNCYRPTLPSGHASNKLGWETTEKSKGALYDTMYRWLEYKQLIIHSRNFSEEMKTFKRHENLKGGGRGTYSAARGFCDDELMACCIALFVAHKGDYDENLGYVVMRAQLSLENALWHMQCLSCNTRWPAQSLQGTANCPRCRSLQITGTKNPDYVAPIKEDPQHDMMQLAPEPPGELPDYDML